MRAHASERKSVCRCSSVWNNGSVCREGGGGCSRQRQLRTPSSRRRTPRTMPYAASRESGRRSVSAAALSAAPPSKARSSIHKSDALNVWRGNTLAKNSGKVFPQPPRSPRSEQNTRWPRTSEPFATAGSFPRSTLWRLSVPRHPQCGQQCRLSEKARRLTPPRHPRNEPKSKP